MSRAVVIPAPTGRVSPDVTGFTIGAFGAFLAAGGPLLLLWLAKLNGFY